MKSLEARIADRKKRDEEAAKTAEAQGEVLRDKTGSADGGTADEGSYEGYTVAELKEELDGREIAYAASDKKADLIAALEANDNEG